MLLLLIRHGESTGNQEQRIQGRTDFALTPAGQGQVQRLGKFLASQSWQPTHVYSSPLVRSHHTAQLLCQALATPQPQITLQADLQEIANGILTGLTWAEAEAQYPQLCAQLTNTLDWVAVPGAESPQDCRDRAHRVIQTFIATHQNPDRIWVVSHGGFLQYLVAELLGCDRTWGIAIAPTAIFELELDLTRWNHPGQTQHNPILWKIHRFNQTPHGNPGETPGQGSW